MNPYSTHQVQVLQDAHKVYPACLIVPISCCAKMLHWIFPPVILDPVSYLIPPGGIHFVWYRKLSAEFCLISKSKSLLSAWGVYRGGCETAESRRWIDDKNEHIYWIILVVYFKAQTSSELHPYFVNTNPLSVIRPNQKQWKKITASQHCHVTLKTLKWRHSLVSNW